MDVDDNFYDEMSSLMPPPGDYSLDDLDEIIRSTDSQLDASLDLHVFENDFDMLNGISNAQNGTGTRTQQQLVNAIEHQPSAVGNNQYNFNFSAFPSPASSHQSSELSSSGFTPPYDTSALGSSNSSLDGDHFNPDDFINFLNDDDVKIDDLTHDSLKEFNEQIHRNTPSPTGSYSSSSGSSTSGIQSDASSVASLAHPDVSKQEVLLHDDDDLSEFIKFKNQKTPAHEEEDDHLNVNEEEAQQQVHNANDADLFVVPSSIPFQNVTATILPMSIAAIQPVLNVVQNPLNPSPSSYSVQLNSKIQAPVAVKAHKQQNTTLPQQINKTTSPSATSKITPPPNAKPKTIFLSSNDFKALMQKVNVNGNQQTDKKSNGPISGNALMPKIIMKTASGKVITANKITTNPNNLGKSALKINQIAKSAIGVSSSSMPPTKQQQQHQQQQQQQQQHHHQYQQHSKHHFNNSRAAAIAAARASISSHSKLSRADFTSSLRGLSDEKVLKKQLRMLKNRESASLSRRKKKEYVERLEYHISNLEKENSTLKGENSSLRSQLMAFAQSCNCKNSNVSEFILNTLNLNSNKNISNVAVLNAIDTAFLVNATNSNQHNIHCAEDGLGGGSTQRHAADNGSRSAAAQHIKIAPKPPNAPSNINKNFRQRLSATAVRKNVAVLFAMAFMVTLNVGNFNTYLNKTSLENAMELSAANEENTGGSTAVASNGRRLLWVPTEGEYHEQNNRSKRESEKASMPPPPLHFLRPINRTAADKLNGTTTKDEPPIRTIKYGSASGLTNATNYIQEENIRLARNLNKWIGGNDYLNLTGSGYGQDLGNLGRFKYDADFLDIDLPLQGSVGTGGKRKMFFNNNNDQATDTMDGGGGAAASSSKQAKIDMELNFVNDNNGNKNSLDLFKPRISEEYLKLFKGIKRQDDTFYVLSFNMDHILLPASAYNKSTRPKMSLLLPAGYPSSNGDIVLMQIDCEVVNTTELEIKSHMIPEKLRPTKYNHNTANSNAGGNDVALNETSRGMRSAGANNKADEKDFVGKEKQPPRTYFMMGPKVQTSAVGVNNSNFPTAAIAAKRKPNIVKLNANADSIIGSGVLNVRNSTLFTKMRETIVNSNSASVHGRNGLVGDIKKLI